MKRIFLFLATNLAILVVLGVVLSVLGIDSRSTSGALIVAAIFGMGGSFVSLAMSKWIAKSSTGAQVIDRPGNNVEAWLLQTVARQAEEAGIGMPEVAIYPGPDINAFATGMNRDNALVAVSTGLLENMDRDEAEAVLGHEVSHVANGDMVTLAFIQGVLNTFVIFLARLVASFIDAFLSRRRRQRAGYQCGRRACVCCRNYRQRSATELTWDRRTVSTSSSSRPEPNGFGVQRAVYPNVVEKSSM